MDYRVYHLSRKEVCKSITLAGLLTVAIAYLFYASWLGIAFFPVFIWFFMKRQKKAGEEQKQQAGFFKRLLFSAAELTGTIDYEEMAETGLAALGAAIERWKKPEDPFHQTLLARWDEAILSLIHI